MERKPHSRWLLLFSVWTTVCGLAIIGLGVWNGTAVSWNELSGGITAFGAVMVVLSLLGILSSKGCTFCCNIGLYVFVFVTGLLSLAQAVFIVLAALKESDWVADLAGKHTNEESVAHLKEEYDEFWPYFIAFGAVTAFGSVAAFLAGFVLMRSVREKASHRRSLIRDPERDIEDGVKRRNREVRIQMEQKYGGYARNAFSKKKGDRLNSTAPSF